MKKSLKQALSAVALGTLLYCTGAMASHDGDGNWGIDVGDRPALLVEGMDDGRLRDELSRCLNGEATTTHFSIGHRGAPRQFPEHTRESYEAAARQGAGILECDVTFTSDRELVCRHSQCDLHTTTDILAIPELAAKCSQPFVPADPQAGTPASARCCTSDITLAEFRRLKGKRDKADPSATTVEQYLGQSATRGTLMTHAESIELFRHLGTGMTPELKAPDVPMPYQGDYTREDYAQQMIDEYRAAGVDPKDVWPQSFNLEDIRYWIEHEPQFAKQAVYLDSRVWRDSFYRPSLADFERLKARGVEIIAPPMFALLALDSDGNIVPSEYALLARAAGLDIVTWTIERSDLRNGAVNEAGKATFYYRTIGPAITRESDLYKALDVLAREVRIEGIFSDWPATVTFYANCMGLE